MSVHKDMSIDQFMWRYQHRFRRSMIFAAERAFKQIGLDVPVNGLLIGFARTESARHPICVEPENGYFEASALSSASERAQALFDAHPDSRLVCSVREAGEARHAVLLDGMRARAICEALSAATPETSDTFFCFNSTVVADYSVYPVLILPDEAVDAAPRFRIEEYDDDDSDSLLPSLVHALAAEILMKAGRALNEPGTPYAAIGETEDLVRGSGILLLKSISTHVFGDLFEYSLWQLLNKVSQLPYEGRTGAGSLLLANDGNTHIAIDMQFESGVALRDVRGIRKLLEATGDGYSLLVDEDSVYGLGRVSSHETGSPYRTFNVDVIGRGAWDIGDCRQQLMSVRDGECHLPVSLLDVAYLRDLIGRLFKNSNPELLIELAQAATQHSHGAMIVISDEAESEADRFTPQSLVTTPTRLSAEAVVRLTAIDGAILLDPDGNCHAIGVILDGRAARRGESSRGSRINNAIRYLDTETIPTVVIAYSADRTIDILPNFPMRTSRSAVARAVSNYIHCTTSLTPDLRAISAAWDSLSRHRFYLSEGQCQEVNAAMEIEDQVRINNTMVRILREPLRPDPNMDDSFWL